MEAGPIKSVATWPERLRFFDWEERPQESGRFQLETLQDVFLDIRLC